MSHMPFHHPVRRAPALLASVLVASSLAACGDDDRPPTGDPTLDELPAELGTAFCAALDDCLGPLAEIFLGAEDCATTFARQLANAELDNIRAAVDAGRATYHPERARDCFAAIEAAGCGVESGLPAVCEEALEGTVAAGGACSTDVECVGDAFCDRNGVACPGTCTARVAEGTPCTEDDECARELACSDSTGVCARPIPGGAACGGSAGGECEAGAVCVGEDEGTPGTCRAPTELFTGAAGASCDLDAGTLCQPGLSCVVTSAGAGGAVTECRAAASSGGACGLGVPDQCPAGEYCDADPMGGSFEGVCVALPSDGEACAATAFIGTGCAPYHRCVREVCRPVAENGGACADDEQCYSSHCDSGVCAAVPACG